MRKWLAGGLIRAAHFIYRPTVTELADQFTTLIGADGSVWNLSGMPPERRESRGWPDA